MLVVCGSIQTMHKLADYLARKNITGREFADKIDAHPSTVSRILSGNLTPTIDLACRIKAATGGLIKVEDWLRP